VICFILLISILLNVFNLITMLKLKWDIVGAEHRVRPLKK
jgi:hypothetical protein